MWRRTGSSSLLAGWPRRITASASGSNTSDDELAGLTSLEASTRIQNRSVTAVQLTQAVLNRIRVYNPIPALTLPCGFSKSGLPVGLMIAGPHFSEGKVLALAYAFQQATEWHMRKPILTPTMAVPPLVEDDLQAQKKS